MGLRAGPLRHRVNVEERQEIQNPDTGAMESSWTAVLKDEPADIRPLRVSDFIAAKAEQSEITTKIVMRWQSLFDDREDGKPPQLRIVHGSKVYWPAGFFSDPKYGNEYVTAPCKEGVQYT